MILNSMKSEFRYDIKSKFLIIITILLTAIMCTMVYIQYVQVDSTMSISPWPLRHSGSGRLIPEKYSVLRAAP